MLIAMVTGLIITVIVLVGQMIFEQRKLNNRIRRIMRRIT